MTGARRAYPFYLAASLAALVAGVALPPRTTLATPRKPNTNPRHRPLMLDWAAWGDLQALGKGGFHRFPHWHVVGFMARDLARSTMRRAPSFWRRRGADIMECAGLDHDNAARLPKRILTQFGVLREAWTEQPAEQTRIIKPALGKRDIRLVGEKIADAPTVPETVAAMERDFQRQNKSSIFNSVRYALSLPRAEQRDAFNVAVALIIRTEFPFSTNHKNAEAYRRRFGVDDPVALYEQRLAMLPGKLAEQVHRVSRSLSLVDTIALPATERSPRRLVTVQQGLAAEFKKENGENPLGDPRTLLVGNNAFLSSLDAKPLEDIRIAMENGWSYKPMSVKGLLNRMPRWYHEVFKVNQRYQRDLSDALKRDPALSIDEAVDRLAPRYEKLYPTHDLTID